MLLMVKILHDLILLCVCMCIFKYAHIYIYVYIYRYIRLRMHSLQYATLCYTMLYYSML